MSESEEHQSSLTKHAQSKRIRVACNTCRKKKIRCDGAARCMNCAVAQEPECIYDERVQRPERKKPRVSKPDETVVELNSRLDRLENMLHSVISALPREHDTVAGSPVKAEEKSLGPLRLSEEDTADNESAGESPGVGRSRGSPSYPVSESNAQGKVNEIYLGNHSFFSILSKSSLSWMKSRLSPGDAHMLVPLSNLPLVFENKAKRFVNFGPRIFGDSRFADVLKSPLPKKKDVIMDLVSNYKNSFNAAKILCTMEEINDIIKKYYSSSNPNKRNLQIVQLFKLCLAISICLSDAMEASFNQVPARSPDEPMLVIGGLNLRDISFLKDRLIEACMGYFYQLSVGGQGLETVKSLLFFSVFLAKCNEPPEITHMVLTQAIRKALDMGLHRIETYRSCTRETYEIKLLVWKTSCYFDMEMCFRTGKPPIINYSDISEELRSGLSLQCIANQSFPLPFLINYDMIFQIRLETYNRLISATADTRTFDALQRNVDILNEKMFGLLARMSPEDRPYFYNQPGFKEITSIANIEEEHRMTTILTFFVNMMTINRLPTMFAFPGVRVELLQVYKNLSLNSARSIMHLLKNFHAFGPGKAPSLWITYFPVISVLHLLAACMTDPRSPDAYSDMLLILEMCETWFNRKLTPDSSRSFRFDMSVLIQVLVKCVTYIAINIFETNTGVKIVTQDERMKGFFDAPRKFYPELFGSAETLQKSIPLIFESKSPFPSETTATPRCSPCSLANSVESYGPPTQQSETSSVSEGISTQNANFDTFEPDGNLAGLDNLFLDQLDEFSNFFFDGVSGG